MKKLKKILKSKKVLVVLLAGVVIIGSSTYYLYNNNKAYESKLEVLNSLGVQNDDFWHDNKLIRPETLNYMQSQIDSRIGYLNDELKYINTFIEDNNLTSGEEVIYENKYDEYNIKQTVIIDYLTDISVNRKIDLDNNEMYASIDAINTGLDNRITSKLNSIEITQEYNDSEINEYTKYNDELDAKKSKELDSLSISEKIALLDNTNTLISNVKDFNSSVSERQKNEQDALAQAQSDANNYTPSEPSSNSYNSNNDTSGSSNSNNTNNNSSASNNAGSGQDNTPTPAPSQPAAPLCPYPSLSSADAAGAATGGGYMAWDCGDGSFQMEPHEGDNTGNNNGWEDW